MALKYAALFGLIVVAGAIEYRQQYDYSAPAQYSVYKHAEPEAPAHYDYSYAVHDEHTGDVKEQKESREGDVVHGSYSLVDADGYKRIVEYTVDKHSGFNAVVHRQPLGHNESYKPKASLAKVVPLVYAKAAPAVQQYYQSAPVAHYNAAHLIKSVPAPSYNNDYHNADAHVSFNGPAANYHY